MDDIYENNNFEKEYYVDEEQWKNDADYNQKIENQESKVKINDQDRSYKARLVSNTIDYPEIYHILSPMIEKAIKIHQNNNFDKACLEEITNEVYTAIDDKKELQNEKDNTLYDLIKILIIKQKEN